MAASTDAPAAPQLRPRCDAPSGQSGFIRNDSFIDLEGNLHSEVNFTGALKSAKQILRHMLIAYIVYAIRIIQICYASSTHKLEAYVQPLVNALPVILVGVGLSVMAVDQGTDVAQSYQICNVPCRCIWLGWLEYCMVPLSTGGGDLENDQCLIDIGNFTFAKDYCNAAGSESECNNLEPWSPATYRHPLFCLYSIATILVPSIINSTYLLISLWILYPYFFKQMGISEVSFLHSAFIKTIFLVLYILQLLPYTWLAMNFIINLKSLRTGLTEEAIDKENRNKTSKRSKLVFTILEDTPQLLLHSMFIVNSAIAQDNSVSYAGIDMLHTMSYLAMSSSAASIALTLTLFQELPTYTAAIMHFCTTFVSVGTRALVCATYASAVENGFGPLTWPIVLPPITVIGLVTIEYIFIYIYNYIVYIRQKYSVNGGDLQITNGIVKKIRKCIVSIREWKTMLNYNSIMFISRNIEKMVRFIVSFTFEANSTQCLISSYSYLAFAVTMNISKVSISVQSKANYDVTQSVLLTIQYLSLSSLLINLVIVQWKGKAKIYCFVYSLMFLVFVGVIYIWVKNDFTSFVDLFSPGATGDSQESINISLSSLNVMFYIAGIIASSDLIIIIISYIKCKS